VARGIRGVFLRARGTRRPRQGGSAGQRVRGDEIRSQDLPSHPLLVPPSPGEKRADKRFLPHPAASRDRFGCKGFTLAELAIVLVIVALLIGGMLVPLSAQRDLQDIRETQRQLSDIAEALSGYAASHAATGNGKPYLPCPDTDGDGFENRSGDACVADEGRLPWSDLGVGREDAWGNRFRYRVANAYAHSGTGFTLETPPTGSSPPSLRACEDAACATVIAAHLPAVIVSHGKNGAGAFDASGGTNPAPVGTDEIANQNGDGDFVLHPPSGVPGSEFDDLVAWVSPYILFNRMITAGRLP
jgi:prepilin-type N-terminal cleavage/methylation domain-containing protein